MHTLLSLLAWLAVVHGVTQVITVSRVFYPVRALLAGTGVGDFLKCSMCAGWWVGLSLSQWGWFFPGLPSWKFLAWPLPAWASFLLSALCSAFAASAWAYLARGLHPDAPEHPDDE